ncbi:Uncharacterised protein [Burkholderia pseudomallei]|nr:Uncharacterised protein [Burkholderia pseudomallei]CFT70242.1 Uncharacterised protein [Burkholderia pseudomallei]
MVEKKVVGEEQKNPDTRSGCLCRHVVIDEPTT